MQVGDGFDPNCKKQEVVRQERHICALLCILRTASPWGLKSSYGPDGGLCNPLRL